MRLRDAEPISEIGRGFCSQKRVQYKREDSGCGAAWLARLLGVQEVPGSNPGSPTKPLKDLQSADPHGRASGVHSESKRSFSARRPWTPEYPTPPILRRVWAQWTAKLSLMTDNEFEALWLESLRDDAADTVGLLSSARKQERERRTCAAFLRCAGVDFTPDQIVSSTTEPPDVVFSQALFEITIVVPPGRRMHAEWRATTARRESARQIGDLIEPYAPPEVLTRETLVHLIAPASGGQISALFYSQH